MCMCVCRQISLGKKVREKRWENIKQKKGVKRVLFDSKCLSLLIRLRVPTPCLKCQLGFRFFLTVWTNKYKQTHIYIIKNILCTQTIYIYIYIILDELLLTLNFRQQSRLWSHSSGKPASQQVRRNPRGRGKETTAISSRSESFSELERAFPWQKRLGWGYFAEVSGGIDRGWCRSWARHQHSSVLLRNHSTISVWEISVVQWIIVWRILSQGLAKRLLQTQQLGFLEITSISVQLTIGLWAHQQHQSAIIAQGTCLLYIFLLPPSSSSDLHGI